MPLIVITVLMLMGYSPGYSAIIGIVTCLVISWFRKDTRIGPKQFVEASRSGAENSLKIGATVGVIGIIIGVLTYSGLVLTFADIVKVFVLIIIGTTIYSWLFSGIWIKNLAGFFKKAPAS